MLLLHGNDENARSTNNDNDRYNWDSIEYTISWCSILVLKIKSKRRDSITLIWFVTHRFFYLKFWKSSNLGSSTCQNLTGSICKHHMLLVLSNKRESNPLVNENMDGKLFLYSRRKLHLNVMMNSSALFTLKTFNQRKRIFFFFFTWNCNESMGMIWD